MSYLGFHPQCRRRSRKATRGLQAALLCGSLLATPWLFAAGAFTVVVNEIVAHPADTMMGLGLVLAGLPVYFFWARRGLPAKEST